MKVPRKRHNYAAQPALDTERRRDNEQTTTRHNDTDKNKQNYNRRTALNSRVKEILGRGEVVTR